MKTLALAMTLIALHAAAWSPPERPDPQAILNEARTDRAAKRYDEALQKYLWFRTEVLKVRPAMSGIRLWLALNDWGTLALRHPPAMEALREVRAELAANVRAGIDVLESFHDLALIDRELEDHAGTQEVFRVLEVMDPCMATSAYGSAKDALIEARDFGTAARYLQPDFELKLARAMYGEMATPRSTLPAEMRANLREKVYGYLMSRVVAVLVLGGKREEARLVSAEALKVSDSATVREMLTRAGEGQMPAPLVPAADKAMMRRMLP